MLWKGTKMANNWGRHFSTDGYCDHIEVCAETIVGILEAPGKFMLEVGMDEEDLEAHDPAVVKVATWLRKDAEPWMS